MPELLVLFAVIIAETILSLVWVPAYFHYGIPIFRIRVPSLTGIPAGAEDRLESLFTGSAMTPLVFRRFDAQEIAFRERAYGFAWFRYAPIMHGLIRQVPEEGAVHVIGWLNWSAAPLLVFAIWISSSGRDDSWFFPLAVIAVFTLSYAFQAVRYRKVAASLATAPV